MSNSQGCYAEFSHPSLKDAINQNNSSTFKLSLLVAEFAQQMAAAHEQFAKEVQTVIGSFRRKNNEFKFERPVDTPCSIQKAWESLLHETEMDAQAHLDAASLLIKNVYKPLEEVAIHKQSQAQKLNNFRNKFEDMLQKVENQILTAEKDYMYAYDQYQDCQINKTNLYNAHNEYIFQLRASNRSIDQFQLAIPQVLEELEEIYIDTSNTVNVAIESHALLLLTKANEQHRRFEDLLQVCRQVNPQLDISYFVNALNPDCAKLEIKRHRFHPVEASSEDCTCLYQNQLIIDKSTESALLEKRTLLQREAAELTSYITQNQDISHSLVNICQRNLANHLYSKVYETQEDMCRKRNEIRMANIQLAAVRAQIDLLTPKQNGTVENTDQDKSAASIKGMWKKAFKSLKSSSSDTKLSKKSSLKKKQQGSKEEEEEQEQESKEIDPVYSLLKCAADLPKGARIPCIVHSQSAGQHNPDSSSSTSKTSSPSSSVSHSPKARRKKLNARMKSFSLDAPDPSKHHLLAIDEITKKKSSSFTNTCLRGAPSPDEKYALSASNLRKKFAASAKSSSLDIESGGWSTSPKESPKVSRKMKYEKENSYVVLYHFKGKEKDDMDLRAGSRVKVTDSSDPDWWKGKCNAKAGYFPAKYVISLQKNQKVFQVSHAMHLTDGDVDMKLHKDQIVLQIGDEEHGMMLVKAANNKQAMCPLKYLNEV